MTPTKPEARHVAAALRNVAQDLLRVADNLAARPGPVPGRGVALRELVAEAVRVSNCLALTIRAACDRMQGVLAGKADRGTP